MRWLLDQGLARSAAEMLRQAGHDALHVGEIGRADAADAAILKLAADEQRVVVTLDADFHALLAMTAATQPSVIRIREEGLKGREAAQLILAIHAQFADSLLKGCVVTVARGSARLRFLPMK
jgi:predicted nuclease of predicted toxin-antitoxin system